jgi:hypothetical protein
LRFASAASRRSATSASGSALPAVNSPLMKKRKTSGARDVQWRRLRDEAGVTAHLLQYTPHIRGRNFF